MAAERRGSVNREIKFRAWDGESMVYEMCMAVDRGSEIFKVNFHTWPNYEFMQYTTLKDVNKKEIYENDIVVINGKKYQVVWGWGIYKFVAIGKHDSLFVYDVAVNGDVMGEVIGNIYSNPELLEVADAG
jgi:hypothetical protein